MRILYVEDHELVRRAIGRTFQSAGYAVEYADSLAGARRMLSRTSYEAVLLDRHLPDGDGLVLCRELRASGSTMFVFVLTARDAADQVLDGYDQHVDLYMPKGQDARIYVAHVDAFLRRTRSTPVAVGPLTFDPVRQRLELPDGTNVMLSVREQQFFLELASRPGELVDNQHLLSRIWEGKPTQLSGLPALVYRVRAKLGDYAWMIKTVHGVGYRLVLADTPGSKPPAPPGSGRPGSAKWAARSS